MEMLGKIRRMHLRDKLSLHEIAKRTGLSRNTIRAWLRKPDPKAAPKYQRRPVPLKIDPYRDSIIQALKADAHRPKHERRTAKALFAQTRAAGYSGCYPQVTKFIREWRQQEGKEPKAFVPLQFELGDAFQFDWSEEGIVIGGVYRKLQVAHMKLCASRAFWLVGLSKPRPRDAVRRPCALPGSTWRGCPTRHLRQHENSGRQGQQRQGAHRQRQIRRHVRALPVRSGLL
jgi:transposase